MAAAFPGGGGGGGKEDDMSCLFVSFPTYFQINGI